MALSRRMAKAGAILFNPKARAYHQPRDCLGGVFRWFVRRGQAQVGHLRHLPGSKGREWFSLITHAQTLRLAAVAIA